MKLCLWDQSGERLIAIVDRNVAPLHLRIVRTPEAKQIEEPTLQDLLNWQKQHDPDVRIFKRQVGDAMLAAELTQDLMIDYMESK